MPICPDKRAGGLWEEVCQNSLRTSFKFSVLLLNMDTFSEQSTKRDTQGFQQRIFLAQGKPSFFSTISSFPEHTAKSEPMECNSGSLAALKSCSFYHHTPSWQPRFQHTLLFQHPCIGAWLRESQFYKPVLISGSQ